MERPSNGEYGEYYGRYIDLVRTEEVLALAEQQCSSWKRALPRLKDCAHFRYAVGKWSVSEMVGHLSDAERVFGYRAFCISRGETAPLNSFDEDRYTAAGRYDELPLPELMSDFESLRQTNLRLFRRLNADEQGRIGTASGHPVSVRALAYMLVGHVIHHERILGERYGITI